MALSRILIFFVVFPFTQIVPLATYNQPYAMLVAFLICALVPGAYLQLPQADRIMLGYLAILGLVLFPFAALDGLVFREISYLLSYLTPLLTTTAVYWSLRHHPQVVRSVLTWGIVIWVVVGIIQIVVAPGFLTFLASDHESLAQDVARSGRGALGLAPEPTHFGFHMIILATSLYLVKGPRWAVLLALLATLLIAKSSSALLAFAVGLIFWAAMRPLARIWVFAGIAGALAFSAVVPLLLDDSYRITRIILEVYHVGFNVIHFDYSINARLSGMMAPLSQFWHNYSMPLGMSLDDWLWARNELLARFVWIIDLSSGGPASGVGMVLLHGGFLGVPPVIYLFWRLVVTNKKTFAGLLTAASFVVFFGQLYLATPTIGLLLAAIIADQQERRERRRERANATMSEADSNQPLGAT